MKQEYEEGKVFVLHPTEYDGEGKVIETKWFPVEKAELGSIKKPNKNILGIKIVNPVKKQKFENMFRGFR